MSFVPIIDNPDYNSTVSLNQDDYLGFELENLKVIGKGKLITSGDESREFEFEGPIEKFRLSFELKEAEELKYGKPGKVIKFQKLDFKVNAN